MSYHISMSLSHETGLIQAIFCMSTFFLFLMSSCTSEISPQNLQDGRHRIANYIRTRGMKARNSLSKEKTIL